MCVCVYVLTLDLALATMYLEKAVADNCCPERLIADTACPALIGSPISAASSNICLCIEGGRTRPRDCILFTI